MNDEEWARFLERLEVDEDELPRGVLERLRNNFEKAATADPDRKLTADELAKLTDRYGLNERQVDRIRTHATVGEAEAELADNGVEPVKRDTGELDPRALARRIPRLNGGGVSPDTLDSDDPRALASRMPRI